MAYQPPQFNLLANIWHNPAQPPAAPSVADVPCQLYLPNKEAPTVIISGYILYRVLPQLRLPAGTDVRYDPTGAAPSQVEVPAGSGRKYVVAQVEDAHKGFDNEYRIAFLIPLPGWPTPYP